MRDNAARTIGEKGTELAGRQDLGFESVILGLRDGLRMQRAGWNGKDMWIELRDARDDMGEFIIMRTASGTLIPWVASQTDLLGNDWRAVALD